MDAPMHISGHLATETKDIVNYHKIKLDLKEKQSYLKILKKQMWYGSETFPKVIQNVK